MAKKTRSNGWAKTKSFPHKNHPAHWRRCKNNPRKIHYMTFTHEADVDMPDGKRVKTIPLSGNISIRERKLDSEGKLPANKRRSHAFPRTYRGERDALGKETSEFRPLPEDMRTINGLFDSLPCEDVPVTGGSKKWSKKKKPR